MTVTPYPVPVLLGALPPHVLTMFSAIFGFPPLVGTRFMFIPLMVVMVFAIVIAVDLVFVIVIVAAWCGGRSATSHWAGHGRQQKQ
jgi:hypothetical protein